MSSVAEEVRAAIVARLSTYQPLIELVGDRIYDDPPSTLVFPFLTMDGTTIQKWDAECMTGQNRVLQISAWSELESTIECENIVEAVTDALHDADLQLDTHSLNSFRLSLARIIDDPNPSIKHGVLQFEADITNG